jgi:hypothetical protein
MDDMLDQIAIALTLPRRRALRVLAGLLAGVGSAMLGTRSVLAFSCPSGQRACGPLGDQVCCPGVCCDGSVCCTGCCTGTTSTSCLHSTSHSLCGADGHRCFGCGNVGNACAPDGTCVCCPSGLPDCAIHCVPGSFCVSGACTPLL